MINHLCRTTSHFMQENTVYMALYTYRNQLQRYIKTYIYINVNNPHLLDFEPE